MAVGGDPTSRNPAPPGQRPEVDTLQAGPAPQTPRHRRLVRALALGSVAVVAVAAFAVDAQRKDVAGREVAGNERAAQTPDPTPAPTPTPTPSLPTDRSTPARPSTEPNLALPGAGAWVLFARSDSMLYRIDLHTGRVTPAARVSVGTGGLETMFAGPHQVVISNGESGEMVVVPDGHPSRSVTAPPGMRRQLFPGPDGLLWVQTLDEAVPGSVVLVDATSRIEGPPVPLGGAWPQSDGSGGLLLSDVGGVYQLRGSTISRVSSGSLSAVGMHHFLFIQCDQRHRCRFYLYDRATRQSRRLGPTDTASLPSGVLSPDGRAAALIRWRGAEPPTLDVHDLRQGTSRSFPGQLDSRYGDAATSLAWTPDSRWLIALVDGQIKILDRTTGRIRSSSSRLPTLVQLAMRTP